MNNMPQATPNRFPSYSDEVGISTKPTRDILLLGMGMKGIFDEGGGAEGNTESDQAIKEFKAQGIEVVSSGLKDPLLDAYMSESEG